MTRGRKPLLQDRKTTCISLESRHVDYLQKQGIELSEFVRDCIETHMKNNSSPIEKLRKEIEENKKTLQEKEFELLQQEQKLRELEEEEEIQKSRQTQLKEFEKERENLFLSKYRKLIYHSILCDLSFYKNVKTDFKFNDLQQAQNWLYEHYKDIKEGEKKYTEDRIKTFLRLDSNVAMFW